MVPGTAHGIGSFGPAEGAGAMGEATGRYLVPSGGKLLPLPDGSKPSALEEFVHDGFRALVLNPKFSCVAAKAAIKGETYGMGLFPGMATDASTRALAVALRRFIANQATFGDAFYTFVASFDDPAPHDE